MRSCIQNLLHKPNYQSVFVLQGKPVAWAPHTANRAKPMRMTWQVRAWHRLRPHRWQTPPPSLPSFPCTAVVCRHSPARARLGKGEFTPAAAVVRRPRAPSASTDWPWHAHGAEIRRGFAGAPIDQAQPGPNSPAKHPQLARPLRHRVGSAHVRWTPARLRATWPGDLIPRVASHYARGLWPNWGASGWLGLAHSM